MVLESLSRVHLWHGPSPSELPETKPYGSTRAGPFATGFPLLDEILDLIVDAGFSVSPVNELRCTQTPVPSPQKAKDNRT